jgi:NADP-dependent 3-hydroxy acid dehydrogenase YdfG
MASDLGLAQSIMPFTDQVAVVTGASSGLGKAIALGLAMEGATVCLVGRQLETLGAVAERAPTIAPRILCQRADLTQDNDIRALAAYLQRDFRAIDVLVHSAGVLSLSRLETASVEDFDWQYRTNVRAPYVLTQALLPMIRARQGQVVFLNSSVGLNARANIGQYAATKHALKAIADSLRDEVNADGVRVLSVFLGRTATPMQAAIHKMEGRAYHPELLMQPEDVAAVVINALSVPRSVEVTDISIRPLVKSY